jgi:hypothetical protein
MAPSVSVKQAAQQDGQLAAVPAGKAAPLDKPAARTSAMQAAAIAMSCTSSIKDEPSHIEVYDHIFGAMQQQASSEASLPDMFPASTAEIGQCAANIAILSAAKVQHITPAMINTVFSCLNSSSDYIRDKAQQVLHDVMQQTDLSRPCADTAVAGMRSIIKYFANSKSAAIPVPTAAVSVGTPAGSPAAPVTQEPLAPTASPYAGAHRSQQQLPPLAAWALDMLLLVAHVDEESFLGCMMGSAVGDALGLPIEGNSRKLCQQYVRDVMTWHLSRQQHTTGKCNGTHAVDSKCSAVHHMIIS